MATERGDVLHVYLERLTALVRERGRTLAPDEMKQVARETGISAEDLAAAETVAAAHLERGERFAGYGRWDDAIAELADALLLDPGSLNVMVALGRAHAERWRAGRSQADRADAERYARACLAVDPAHTPSYELLNDLDASAGASVPRERLRSVVRRPVAFLTAMVVVVMVVMVVNVFKGDPQLIADGPSSVMPAATEGAATDNPDIGAEGVFVPITWECTRPEEMNVEIQATVLEGMITLRLLNTGSLPLHEIQFRLNAGDDTYPVATRGRTVEVGDAVFVSVRRVGSVTGGLSGTITAIR